MTISVRLTARSTSPEHFAFVPLKRRHLDRYLGRRPPRSSAVVEREPDLIVFDQTQVPNLSMKKPPLARVVPIISARPPRLAPPLGPHSAANSCASIPHRAEQAIGRCTKRDDRNSDRSS